MSTESLYALLAIAVAVLLGALAGLAQVSRRSGPPLELYRPGDAWLAKGRRR